MTRNEKIIAGFFAVFAAAIVLPGLLLVVVSVVSTGAIELPH